MSSAKKKALPVVNVLPELVEIAKLSCCALSIASAPAAANTKLSSEFTSLTQQLERLFISLLETEYALQFKTQALFERCDLQTKENEDVRNSVTCESEKLSKQKAANSKLQSLKDSIAQRRGEASASANKRKMGDNQQRSRVSEYFSSNVKVNQ
jgi:hypothetical protein